MGKGDNAYPAVFITQLPRGDSARGCNWQANKSKFNAFNGKLVYNRDLYVAAHVNAHPHTHDENMEASDAVSGDTSSSMPQVTGSGVALLPLPGLLKASEVHPRNLTAPRKSACFDCPSA